MFEKFKEKILKYQNKIFRSKIQEFLIKMDANKIYYHFFSAFSDVSNIYFDSAKLLRTNWYNYEAMVE